MGRYKVAHQQKYASLFHHDSESWCGVCKNWFIENHYHCKQCDGLCEKDLTHCNIKRTFNMTHCEICLEKLEGKFGCKCAKINELINSAIHRFIKKNVPNEKFFQSTCFTIPCNTIKYFHNGLRHISIKPLTFFANSKNFTFAFHGTDSVINTATKLNTPNIGTVRNSSINFSMLLYLPIYQLYHFQ
jgi:hypothetical protein